MGWRWNVRALSVLCWTRRVGAVMTLLTIFSLPGNGQDSRKISDPLQDSIQTLQNQTNELKTMMEEMRGEILRSRAEAAALREELQATRDQLAVVAQRGKESSNLNGDAPSPGSQEVQKLEEDQELLSAKVEQQYQTKVESASKYRVRLS